MTLSVLLNARFGISPESAIRLSKVFVGSTESWLIQQTQYDLWLATQNSDNVKVKAIDRWHVKQICNEISKTANPLYI